MSRREQAILRILADAKRELYGLALVKASDGLLKRGTIYVYLARLQEQGLVAARKEEDWKVQLGDISRNLYSLTDEGRAAIAKAEGKQS